MPSKQSTLFDFVPVPAEESVLRHIAEEEASPQIVDIDLEFVSASARPASRTGEKRGRGRMKLSEAAATANFIDIPDDEVLFQKKYYPIGTVAKMFNANISLLRFWENEFDILKPKKNGKGDRLFRPEDVKSLKLIHHLLREKKYTIEGAKDFLKKNKKADEHFALIEELQKIKMFLNELKLSL